MTRIILFTYLLSIMNMKNGSLSFTLRSVVGLSLSLLAVSATFVSGLNPNPPVWPSSVGVFSPSDPAADVTSAVNAAFAKNGGENNNGQFSSERFAFLFMPGTYDSSIEVPVGYYTHVLGLGATPDDTVFTSPKGVYCEEGSKNPTTGALDTFWRAGENFRTQASYGWSTAGANGGMMWAVSQAAPLRRVHVDNNLALYEYVSPYPNAGFASGGFLANSRVDGTVYTGSQQQWFSRSSQVGGWSGGVWNMVFAGVQNAPVTHCGNVDGNPFVTVEKVPKLAEKPFISADTSSGKFYLNIPQHKQDVAGTSWDEDVKQVGFEYVYVADAAKDDASSINAALQSGYHIVISPGIYKLDAPIVPVISGQVIIGLGLATLKSAAGNAVISVPGNVTDVRIAGPFIFEAGSAAAEALVEWKAGNDSASIGGTMHDAFFRVGGPDKVPVSAASMLQVHRNNVIGDNLWLWRADHTVDGAVSAGQNPCTNALVVTGDGVAMYGLAAEHTLGDLVQWSGEDGIVIFFQSELPYDVESFSGAGFRVNATVSSFDGYGLGVYHFFRDFAIQVQSAISVPTSILSRIHNALSVYLNGKGTILHVVNNVGDPTSSSANHVSYYCDNATSAA